ncbi:hypothetical protein EGY07_18420 [Chryseobacterium indologenes]|uniref:Uncharacterized protein n=2 Tax=Chryseobacterium indologenes TaxID=253 RepID=A0A1Z3W876_CHRID|nr:MULTISPECIES: hypothetical protein [Chryseobacterium]ASE63707.1 hypothetical protein CEQ15_20565 [Chryseobacterium indologenes]ATN07712.1 hypothetical protein CRN76_21085 [Chryseobacterium indologenes]AYY83548.1 hypothetical protein EGX91_02745 [Chryseobacterium indologenes]AYZ37368.1 hypothetical protein EGY07_18420 [Chryseobacterium indologenes]AZB19417.1 hypothetical protein EG352_17345 [Chryseobacterium indologenes]
MKKSLLALGAILTLSVISCKKTESGNTGIIKTDSSETVVTDHNGKIDSATESSTIVDVNGKRYEKTDFVYKATDGTLVKVIFKNDPKESTVAITSNKKTFTLPKTETKGGETIYKKDDMTARVKGDSLHLEQGNNIIELKRTKI